jgi:hypothetical protein
VRTAVDQLADGAAAAAIPAAVELGLQPVALTDPVLAEAGARRARQKFAGGSS